jgi:1-phosphofructokinase family hexose kinase
MIFDSIVHGKSNQCKKEFFSAGGKGINVSRQLNKLGIKNYAFTLLGGNNGKIFRSLLTSEKINFGFVSTLSETRSANLTYSENEKILTTYFGINSKILQKEAEEFKAKLDKMIYNSSIVVFSGSSPSEITDDIFSYGISLAHIHDKISILDSYGSHLEKSISAAPTVLHNNKHEIEKSIGISLENEKSIIEYLEFLYSKKIKLSFITDGKNETYASKYDFIYKIIPPDINEIDSTGSGDAFTAGIVYGLEKSLVFEEFVKIASALGSKNASMLETCSVSIEQIEGLKEKVIIEPVGKKMKIIDDSPKFH